MKYLIVLIMLMLSSCTPTINTPSSPVFSLKTCGDSVWVGKYRVDAVFDFTWKGQKQYQATMSPIPKTTPANTFRNHTIIVDTLPMVEGDTFIMIKYNH